MARHFFLLIVVTLLVLQVAARPQTNKDVKEKECKDVKGKYQPMGLKKDDKDETYHKIRTDIGYKKYDFDALLDKKGTVEFTKDKEDYSLIYASKNTKIAPKVWPFKLGVEFDNILENGLKVKIVVECSEDHMTWSETYENGKVLKYDRVLKEDGEVMEVKLILDKDLVTYVLKKVKDEE